MDLQTANLDVPVSHIIGGKVKPDGRIDGAHSAEDLDWLLDVLANGVPEKMIPPEKVRLGPPGKNLYPKLAGGDDALEAALSGESGVVRQVMTDPDEITWVRDNIWKLSREVTIIEGDDRYNIVVEIFTAETKKNDPAPFKIGTAYPRGGDGVINVDQSGTIRHVLKDGTKVNRNGDSI